jgi:hypothetical protein
MLSAVTITDVNVVVDISAQHFLGFERSKSAPKENAALNILCKSRPEMTRP